MEEPFTKVVQQIFNNWTALRLAVDHSMGGPNSKQSALEFMNYIVQYCLYEPNVEVEGIQEALEDIMDEEFETICEDESPKQIAQQLYKFLILLKQGKTIECEVEFQNLPNVNTDWLNQQSCAASNAVSISDSSDNDSETDEDTPASQEMSMEQDGWTEVKSKRKR